MNKEDLEIVLKAIKLLKENNYDLRKSLTTIEEQVKSDYVKLVVDSL